MAVRVGEKGSLVSPGDPIPGKPGHYYEAGQYAPSPAHLTTIKLLEMQNTGLLSSTGLDIYDSDNNISKEKIESLDISKELKKYFINNHSPDLPGFAFVGLASVLNNIDLSVLKYLQISNVNWIGDISTSQDLTLIEEAQEYSEYTQTTDRNIISAYSNNSLDFDLMIFQPFYVYLSVPIVPAVLEMSSGLNLSSVSVLKTIGSMMYEKIKLTDKILYAKILEVLGWAEKRSLKLTELQYYKYAGTEVGRMKSKNWMRNTKYPAISASSTFSPKENFSELFMYYYVHRMYLFAKQKSYVKFMDSLIENLMEA